jgi:5,10-methylenetetrahydromethanopterin reductase
VPAELFTTGLSHPAVVERMAVAAEAAGWDGMLVVDSQNLAGDAFVGLALAARATTHLRLGTGVTNPATRHPAATAAGIASVHAASGGRAVLGIGRGDSALSHLGLAPVGVDELVRYVTLLRAYLRGDGIDFGDLAPYASTDARPVDVLGLARAAPESRLHWLDPSLPAVPVEIVATGPRMLEAAARSADRVLLAVGADVQRVEWAVRRVRGANPGVPVGAFVNVVVHDDLDEARRLAAGGIATFARFSIMDGTVRTPIDAASKRVLAGIHEVYDMTMHTRSGSAQAGRIDDAFADRFAIIGTAQHCIERLQAVIDIGIDRLVVVGPALDADRSAAKRARDVMVAEVLPAVRAPQPATGAGR